MPRAFLHYSLAQSHSSPPSQAVLAQAQTRVYPHPIRDYALFANNQRSAIAAQTKFKNTSGATKGADIRPWTTTHDLIAMRVPRTAILVVMTVTCSKPRPKQKSTKSDLVRYPN